jgi:hypothetical protein
MIVRPTVTQSFERDIRPLFRERDRDSMKRSFDLWSLDDVRAHASTILSASNESECLATRPGRNPTSTRCRADMAVSVPACLTRQGLAALRSV